MSKKAAVKKRSKKVTLFVYWKNTYSDVTIAFSGPSRAEVLKDIQESMEISGNFSEGTYTIFEGTPIAKVTVEEPEQPEIVVTIKKL